MNFSTAVEPICRRVYPRSKLRIFLAPPNPPCAFFLHKDTVLTSISGKSSAWFSALYTYMRAHSPSPTVFLLHSCRKKCLQTSSGGCHHPLFSPPGHFIYLFCEWPHGIFPLGGSSQIILLWTLLYTFSDAQTGFCWVLYSLFMTMATSSHKFLA